MNPAIVSLMHARQASQKGRIATSNRLSAIERGDDKTSDKGVLEELMRIQDGHEQEIEALLKKAIKTEEDPVFMAVMSLRGIGPVLAARLLTEIDFTKCDTVSALWRYAGFGVVDGKRERLKKGEKAHFNRELKTTLWLIATSFLKSKSPYRAVYDSAKEKFAAADPKRTPGHCNNHALGVMVKTFMFHLYLWARTFYGLPTRPLYVTEHLGHKTVKEAFEFGWPDTIDPEPDEKP